MNVLDELRNEARASYEWLESIVGDVSPEQATWQPPGRANTIASTYAHIVRNADEDLNQHLFERTRLNEGAWRGRIGLPREDNSVEWEEGVEIDWLQLREYGRAIHGSSSRRSMPSRTRTSPAGRSYRRQASSGGRGWRSSVLRRDGTCGCTAVRSPA